MDCTYERHGDTIRCVNCLHQIAWTKDRLPRHNCRGVLNWAGRLLMRLPPGDGIAHAAKIAGMALLAKLWEETTGKPCGCRDRQAWLNREWRRFVWRHFATPHKKSCRVNPARPAETAATRRQPQPLPQPSDTPAG